MSGAEMYPVSRGLEIVVGWEVIARVRVLFETRIVAAGDLQPDPVPACEDDANGPEVDFQLSYFTGRKELRRFQTVSQLDALNRIEQQDRSQERW